MIALHPQRTERADELRWHAQPGVVVPAVLEHSSIQALLDDATLVAVRLEDDAIITRLAPQRNWAQDGARVRTALHEALAGAVGLGNGRQDGDSDDALRAAAAELVCGPVGDLARSHGGRIDLVTVRDGVVEVSLQGACHGCPAARTTLAVQLEDRLRARHPELKAVRAQR